MAIGQKVKQFTTKNTGTVKVRQGFGDDMVRIRFEPAWPIDWKPGQAIATVVDPDGDGMKDRWRHYTLRSVSEDGLVELVIAGRNAETPGISWLTDLSPGDTFTFMGPGGSPTLTEGAPHYVFVGDRTSLASISAMIDGLHSSSADSEIDVVIATEDPSRAELPTSEPTAVTWVVGDPSEAATVEAMSAALPDALPSGTRAYVTGEQSMMRALRGQLFERGVARRSVGCHAHWTPGKRGM